MVIHKVVGSPKEGRELKVRKKTVNAYFTSLMRTWVKLFGLENVAPGLRRSGQGENPILIAFCVRDILLYLKQKH